MILVDDGSPDRCGVICDEYAGKDRRIKVIHKENGGLSSARNQGLDIAKGQYIGFIDSDDYINEDMYSILLSNAKKHDADISQCGYIIIDDQQMEIAKTSNQVSVLTNIDALNNLYNELYVPTVITVNKIYRKVLFEDIRFPERKIHEDEFTTYKLLYKANKIVKTDIKLYYYYQSNNSIMRKEFNLKRLDALEAFQQRRIFFKNNNLPELYHKACNSYRLRLISYYFKVRNEISNNNHILHSIKRYFNSLFIEMIKENGLSYKILKQYLFFYLSPTFYLGVTKIRIKLRG